MKFHEINKNSGNLTDALLPGGSIPLYKRHKICAAPKSLVFKVIIIIIIIIIIIVIIGTMRLGT